MAPCVGSFFQIVHIDKECRDDDMMKLCLKQSGAINNVRDLLNAPFDRPVKFSLLFSVDDQRKIIDILNRIRDNAVIA